MSQTIKTLEGFTRKIRAVVPAADEALLYRGHSNRKKFLLLPSLLREKKYSDAEDRILRELVATHPTEFSDDRSTLEQLARVQHYSLPTRLLDATWNPLVALYFAAKDDPGITGEVIILRIKTAQIKYFDSDTVSCIANLAHLKLAEKNTLNFGLPPNDFRNQDAIQRLFQFIRVEKPHFREVLDPNDLTRVLCVKPKQNNRRIVAQNGAFLLFGLTGELDTHPAPGITVERIQINAGKKPDLVLELDRMSINDSTMFPEIDKAAIYISKKL